MIIENKGIESMIITNQPQGFNYVAQSNAKILILGSMPSQLSLEKQQYYAHPRNGFWQIMARLLDFSIAMNYPEKLLALQQHHIALWDVIASCQRQGSLDSDIKQHSIISNDFALFFQHHHAIEHIFFNGNMASQEYHKRVLPNLNQRWQALPCTRLPSTSPAMASLNIEQKLLIWAEIKRVIEC
ncbi:MAG: DNA-deoxyinosine glycosylase [Methylococcaceae bacterium]